MQTFAEKTNEPQRAPSTKAPRTHAAQSGHAEPFADSKAGVGVQFQPSTEGQPHGGEGGAGGAGGSGSGGSGSGGMGGGTAGAGGNGLGNSIRSIPVHGMSRRTVQAKLTVNQPGDAFEQEADSVADRVMRMPEPNLQRAECRDCDPHEKDGAAGRVMRMPEPVVQRAACRECAAREKEEEHGRTVQRKSNAVDAAAGTAAPPVVHQALSRPGEPLDRATRGFMEPRFGRDFGNVRVHSDGMAAGAARAIDAQAYTVGNHIVFGAGRYAPGTQSGRQLIAHELTHTIQQGGAPAAAPQNSAGAGARSLEGPAVPAAPRVSRVSGERVARADKVTTAQQPQSVPITVNGAYMTTTHVVTPFKTLTRTAEDGTSLSVAQFNVDQFVLPGSKGPKALPLYQQLASQQALAATLDVQGVRTKAALWQERANTDELRARWLKRVKWTSGQENRLWQAAGGDSEFPKIGGKACQMDHVVELQAFGNNSSDNIQTLDAKQNGESGRAIMEEVFTLGKLIVENATLSDGKASQIILRFNTASMQGQPEAPPASCSGAPGTATCLAIDHCAEAVGKRVAATQQENVQQGNTTAQGTPTQPADAAPAKKLESFDITSGVSTTLQVPEGFNKSKSFNPVSILDSAENKAASELIPGFQLMTLNRKSGVDTISARIDTREGKGRTRLPITMDDERGASITFNVAKDSHVLSLAKGSRSKVLKFQYPYLSPGEITKLDASPETGLQFQGVIHTSVPLLGQINVTSTAGSLAASKTLDAKSLKPGFTGMRITNADVAMNLGPEFKPSGTVSFEVGPKGRPIVSATVAVSADSQGFLATGDMTATVPGMDEAKGKVSYRPVEGWSGSVKLATSKSFIRNVNAELQFGKDGVSVTGGATISLPNKPNNQEVALTAEKEKGSDKWVFTGTGIFRIPGDRVDPVVLNFRYDGTKVTGSGKTGFKLKSLSGELHVNYDDGKISGRASVKFKKAKSSGEVNVKLSPAGKLSGDGTITYQITDGIAATAGLSIDENDKTTLKGALQFTEPIDLFKAFGGSREIFSITAPIPIPGASIGPVGLKGIVRGSLNAGYHIGPGQIRGAKATAIVNNPLDNDPHLDLTLEGQLYIGADASITGAISGGVMLDAFVASASGELGVSATAQLNASLSSVVKVHYSRGRFELDANFDLPMALLLRLALQATVRAEAGIGPFKVETHKTWDLASYTYDPGLKLRLKMRKPIHYASDQPFSIPSVDDIEVIKPTFSPTDMLKSAFAGARSRETKS
ncbi:MAG TPA: DUF4157 domain-containing protein [Candidatus Kapabacteria bacterium]|nr:DUF4157 domain-containing protein [Candidatus Kapabacteria bacterium]